MNYTEKVMDLETRYARLLTGDVDNTPLLTDGYKFSMAQAGFPLRHEEFYLHFRKGGPQFIPFDLKAVVTALRPRLPSSREQGFLLANGYGLTPAMEAALQGEVTVYAQPQGTWANEQEPVLAISGPSFLVSWYEALLIALQFPMQVATALLDGQRDFRATCPTEGEIIKLVAEALQVDEPHVEVMEGLFRENLRTKLALLKGTLGGSLERAFEVGTRSMTCYAQHRIVLEECKAAGIQRTANVLGAYDFYLIPVGTTGHEHQERHGADIDGFRAIRDCRPEPPSYLFDTYDPLRSGIPAAIATMLEDRTRRCSVRFDSGNHAEQLRRFVQAESRGCHPIYLFMDGYDANRVNSMELEADKQKVEVSRRHYGLGGWLVIDPDIHQFHRNRVAMVFKLCETGGPGFDGKQGSRPVRKYSGSTGKASLAGRPRLHIGADGTRYIIQQGEGWAMPGGTWQGAPCGDRPTKPSVLSPGTQALNDYCLTRDLGGLA
jgi:nicotinic acid phosphoribosyltransferase